MAANKMARKAVILFGSETGTAQDVAEHIQRMALARNLSDILISAMNDFNVEELPMCSIAIFVVATTGDGEPPENMKMAWRALLRKNLGGTWMNGVNYAVFGLGDSSYSKYNVVARRLQSRLQQLGAISLIERGLGDDQHPLGYFGALNPWLSKLWTQITHLYPLPSGFVVDDSPRIVERKYAVTICRKNDNIRFAAAPTRSHPFYRPPHSALNINDGIIIATVVSNIRITSDDCDQEVRHLELDISNHCTPIAYRPGAVALIYPENMDGVEEFFRLTNLKPDDLVAIQSLNDNQPTMLPSQCSVWDLASKFLDIQGIPRRSFFEQLSLFASNPEEKEKLVELSSAEGADLLFDYCIREKRSYIEVLSDFPSAKVPLEVLIQLIPVLKPRLYSLASSSLLHPGKVHLTIAIAEFLTPYKRRRIGITSAFVRQLKPGSQIPMWIKPGMFDLPPPSTHLLLIGPGTGVAPMRSIIQERKFLRLNSEGEKEKIKHGETHLYFGCRHEKKDFIYSVDFKEFVTDGSLTSLNVAFSRDQDRKIYVQTLLAQQKHKVFKLLSEGGYCYVAGSAKRMPSDVYEVLRDIIRDEGKLSLKDAEQFMKRLQRNKRYVVEAWS